MTRLFAATTKSPAQAADEQEWYLDASDVKLTRVFGIVLILHVIAIGGILMFKMIEKASTAPGEIAETRSEAPAAAVESSASGAAAVPPAKEAPAAAAGGLMVNHSSTTEFIEYRVAAGDTLQSIAAKASVPVDKLKELNNLKGDEVFYAGQWLRVPRKVKESPAIAPVPHAPQPPAAVAKNTQAPAAAKPEVPAPAPAKPATVAPPAPGQALASYVVQPGDTAFGIARRFNIKHTELLSANGIVQADLLHVGQTLRIPRNGN